MTTPAVAGHARRIARVTAGDGADRRVDLRRRRWLDPLHLVAVAAAAHRAQADGARFELLGPDGDAAHYAARMGLGEVLTVVGARHALGPVRAWDRHEVLTELTALRVPDDVRAMAELIYDRVAARSERAAAGLHNALAEISVNVCEHSRSIGFAAAQTIPSTGVIRFAVADSGVGMLATLRHRGADDDRTAIGMALSGASRSDDVTRGRGLPSVVRDVSELQGELVVASGTALTVVDRSGRAHGLVAAVPGTLVEARMLTDSRS